MSFLRLILLAGIIWLVYYLIKHLTIKRKASNKKSLETTHMVRCGYCDIYIVKQDAYFKDSHYYCSPEHHEKQTETNPE